MTVCKFLLLVFWSTMLLGFSRYGVTPSVLDIGFIDQEEDGSDTLVVNLSAAARYEVSQSTPKSVVIKFRDDVAWKAPDLHWKAPQSDVGILEGYYAEPMPRQRNRWKIVAKFKRPVRVLNHSIDRSVDEAVFVDDREVPLHQLRIAVKRGASSGGTARAQAERFGRRKDIYGTSLQVTDLQEKVEDSRYVRYILYTNVPVDFDARLDDSGKRLLLTGPGVLEWMLDPEKNFRSKVLLQEYVVNEGGEDGKDSIEFIFKRPVLLKKAGIVGKTFVVAVQPKKALKRKQKQMRAERGFDGYEDAYTSEQDMFSGQEPYDGSYQNQGFNNQQLGGRRKPFSSFGAQNDPYAGDYGYEQGPTPQRAMGPRLKEEGATEYVVAEEDEEDLPQVKKMSVQAAQEVTYVDFSLTDAFEGKAVTDHNGDIIVDLPYTIWDVVDVDDLARRGLFVDYSIVNNQDLMRTKVRIVVQKGTKLLELQNLNEKGSYTVRVILAQDAAFLSPEWLARHGTSELAMTNVEKRALQTRHLVYRGGISDTVSVGKRLELGVDAGVIMGKLTHPGATLPYRYIDEPFTRLRIGVPVYSNKEVHVMIEGSYVKTLSGWDYTAGLHYGHPFYQDREQAMTQNAKFLVLARMGAPIGVASVIYGSAGMGAGYFLDYEQARVPLIKEMDPRRTYYFALGLTTAICDCFTIGLELGYERIPKLQRPEEKDDEKVHLWEGFVSSIGLSYTPMPMSGPSALSTETFVNEGFFVDVGLQSIASNYFVAVGDDTTKDATAVRDRRYMNGLRLGVGYLFFNSPLTLSAEVEVAARDVIFGQMIVEKLKDTTIDVQNLWDIGVMVRPGYMVNHGVRAFLLVGGMQRWCKQVSGPQADKEASEAARRALLTEGVGEYKMLGAMFGIGLDVSATKNINFSASYGYNIFPEFIWMDHLERSWNVRMYESVWRAQLGYNL